MRDLSSAVVIRARCAQLAQSADQGNPPNLNPARAQQAAHPLHTRTDCSAR